MTHLQNQFLREKTFENYDNNSVLELMLTTAGVQGDSGAIHYPSVFDRGQKRSLK